MDCCRFSVRSEAVARNYTIEKVMAFNQRKRGGELLDAHANMTSESELICATDRGAQPAKPAIQAFAFPQQLLVLAGSFSL